MVNNNLKQMSHTASSGKAIDFGYRLDTLEASFLKKDSKANHSLSFIDFSS